MAPLDGLFIDGSGVRVSLAQSELLVAVEHVFTPEAEAAVRGALGAGRPARLVSVDSEAALAAFVRGMGVNLAVGADVDGTAARALGRYDDTTQAWRPGWLLVSPAGEVLAAGDGAPGALGEPAPAGPGVPVRPLSHYPAPGVTLRWWMGAGLAVLLAAGWALVRQPSAPGPAAGASPMVEATQAGSDVQGEPAASAAPDAPKTPGALVAEEFAKLGDGWFAVPHRAARKSARYEGGVIILDADPGVNPMVCGPSEAARAVTVVGELELDKVGTKEEKAGGRVMLRWLNGAEDLMPGGFNPGGGQVLVANGRLNRPWASFSAAASPPPGAVKMRVCADNRASTGTVRVRGLKLQ